MRGLYGETSGGISSSLFIIIFQFFSIQYRTQNTAESKHGSAGERTLHTQRKIRAPTTKGPFDFTFISY
jgi:hypothetical protein